MSTETPTVVQALTAVMRDVGAISKGRRNEAQGFMFRGIDDVMNALHPALIEHGVVVLPEVQERIAETRQTKAGGGMNVVSLRVRFTFHGPAGDKVCAETWGEAQDSADKSTGKAHSAAYKFAMLQALSIPTADTADADATTVDAAPAQTAVDPLVSARSELIHAGEQKGWDVQKLEEQYRAWSEGREVREGSLEDVVAFTAYVRKQRAGEAA